MQEANFVVLLNAHLLSEDHRHHIASITITSNYNLMLVMPSYNPETLTLQIKVPNSNQTIAVRVCVCNFSLLLFYSHHFQGALWRPLAEWDIVHGTNLEIEKRAILMFFGPLVKASKHNICAYIHYIKFLILIDFNYTSLFDANFSKDTTKTHLLDICDFLKIDPKIIKNIVDIIFDYDGIHLLNFLASLFVSY